MISFIFFKDPRAVCFFYFIQVLVTGDYFIPCNSNILVKQLEMFINVYMSIRDIRLGNLNNALFLHISKLDHNFGFIGATM